MRAEQNYALCMCAAWGSIEPSIPSPRFAYRWAVGARFVCIHGHFYQPPRENPWLRVVERQDSARPFHDWNARISAECYGPNARARILDKAGRVASIVNNYSTISFNVGPTLLEWMEAEDRPTYDAILEADRRAVREKGAGVAIAQAHGHLILPLTNARDRHTQVRWGVRDFERRFGRRPKGMWLAETAVDTASLEALVDEGITFTILAPHQALRVRRIGAPQWTDVGGAKVDPKRAYRVKLPSGRSIVTFFYDGPTSRAVAFEGVLDDGAGFGRRLLGLFEKRDDAQLVHIATDGETYGHHHRFGDMALAFALRTIAAEPDVELVSYEQYLEKVMITWEAEIAENTAWSCAHGIERWRSDCGCNTGGGHGTFRQGWRTPLRATFDGFRDRLHALTDGPGRAILADPWGARERYLDVVLDDDLEKARGYLARELPERAVRSAPGTALSGDETRALELLEALRFAMSMYTSCGWFFDDISGIETAQVIAYAARSAELAASVFGERFDGQIEQGLAAARSNIASQGTGADVLRAERRRRATTIEGAAAHFAMSSLFNEYRDELRMFGFDVRFEEGREERRAGRARLGLGVLSVVERSTGRRGTFEYAVVHLGDHNLGGGVRALRDAAQHRTMRDDIGAAFAKLELAPLLRAIDRHFPDATKTLGALFHDEQRRVLDEVLETTLAGVEQSYASTYEQHAPLMRYLASLGQPVPRALVHAAEYTLLARLRHEVGRGLGVELRAVEALLREARDTGVTMPAAELAVPLGTTLEVLVGAAVAAPHDRERIERATELAQLIGAHSLGVDRTRVQDLLLEAREHWPSDTRAPFAELAHELGVVA